MARTFAITTTAIETLKADAKGHAEAVFTVTNTSARPIRGLAKVKALDNTKQEWLALQGESERDFGPAATQQFIINFEGPVIPPTTAEKPKAGGAQASTGTQPAAAVAPTKYSFRLDIASASNPQEDFTEGPVVTVEAAIGKKKTTFPIWIIPIIAVLVIGIGIGLWLWLRPKNVDVPNVIGMPLAEAKTAIEGAKLVAVEEATEVTNNAPAGQVIDQEPKAGGDAVKTGTQIKLVVEGAEPLVSVPDVVKRFADDAKQRLTDKGLTVVTTATDVAEGFQLNQVVTQKPGPEEQVPPGSEVEIAIATEKVVEVPDVRTNPLLTAKQKLAAVGLTFEEQPPGLADASVVAGSVKSQNPGPGAKVPPNSIVRLVVAARPTQVPVLKGKKIAEAQFLLQQKGLEMVVFGTFSQANAATVLITGSAPAALKTVPVGSKVIAFVPCLRIGCKLFSFKGTQVTRSLDIQP